MMDIVTPFLMQSAVQAITPILLAALAGVLCGRVGVFNMALEGQILIGAFAAVVGSFYLGSATGGILIAVMQLDEALGLPGVRGTGLIGELSSLIGHVNAGHAPAWPACLAFVLTIALVAFGQRLDPRFPTPLLALVIAGGLAWLFDLDARVGGPG